jgi:hypothetical protein
LTVCGVPWSWGDTLKGCLSKEAPGLAGDFSGH